MKRIVGTYFGEKRKKEREKTVKKWQRNAPCWCGSGLKYKICHQAFDERILGYEKRGAVVPDRSLIKTEKDVEGIKKSAVINMAVLDEIDRQIHIGMNTQEIDDIVRDVYPPISITRDIQKMSVHRSTIRCATEFRQRMSFSRTEISSM